jgi:GNAT superfamily N-acetyltransferase
MKARGHLIDELEDEHLPAAKALIRRVWHEYFGSDPDDFVRGFVDSDDAFADLDARASHYSRPHGILLVALAGGQLVATAGLRGCSDEVGELTRMFVAPESRRQGIGRELIDRLIAFAAAAGYCKIRLGSNRKLSDSHRLYRSAGFTEIAPYEGGDARYSLYFERNVDQ